MTILYSQVMILASDYLGAKDSENDFSVLCRYGLLTDAIAKWNATCQPCNNNVELVLDGKVGDNFSLKHV